MRIESSMLAQKIRVNPECISPTQLLGYHCVEVHR